MPTVTDKVFNQLEENSQSADKNIISPITPVGDSAYNYAIKVFFLFAVYIRMRVYKSRRQYKGVTRCKKGVCAYVLRDLI